MGKCALNIQQREKTCRPRHKREGPAAKREGRMSLKETGAEVDEIELVGGAGDGGIEPFEILQRERILPESIVHEDTPPLAALRLMTGNGRGVLDLQGIVIRVLTHGRIALALLGDIVIVGIHALVQRECQE